MVRILPGQNGIIHWTVHRDEPNGILMVDDFVLVKPGDTLVVGESGVVVIPGNATIEVLTKEAADIACEETIPAPIHASEIALEIFRLDA